MSEAASGQRTLILGGTGFLGFKIALELASGRSEIVLFGRGKFSNEAMALLPAHVVVRHGDLSQMSDSQLEELTSDFDEIIFAAGADDRRLVKVSKQGSAREYFHRENVGMLERVLRSVSQGKVKSFVLLNSYFATHARCRPEWKLSEKHTYISSRLAQQEMIAEFSARLPHVGFTVLELPFVMGAVPGHPSLFAKLVRWLRRLPVFVLFSGKTALVTAEEVAIACRVALASPDGLGVVPLSSCALEWHEWIKAIHEQMGINRPVLILPSSVFKLMFHLSHFGIKWTGYETGLDLRELMALLGEDLSIGKHANPRFASFREDGSWSNLRPEMVESIREMVSSERYLD